MSGLAIRAFALCFMPELLFGWHISDSGGEVLQCR